MIENIEKVLERGERLDLLVGGVPCCDVVVGRVRNDCAGHCGGGRVHGGSGWVWLYARGA